jgi:hypothetical protein
MEYIWWYVYGFIALATLVALAIVGLKLRKSAIRINRSLDPINQKSKTLKIELSALQRSRLDRQRRLDSTGSKDRNPKK